MRAITRKKASVSTALLFIVALSSFAFVNQAAAEAGATSNAGKKPIVDFIDFRNGTTLTTVDYRNGTKDFISETMQTQIKKVQFSQGTVDQIMSAVASAPNAVKNESNGYVTVTQDMVMEQEVLLGFTYQLVDWRWDIGLDIEVAYAKAGITVDIGFGIRLPVRITLEYPEDMILGHDYELYATLTPLDRPNYDEFICSFVAAAWVEAGIWIPIVGWEEYSYSIGPNYDWSSSFTTPIGSDMEFDVPALEATIWDIWIVTLKAVIDPQLGSDHITTKASAEGDASDESVIAWSEPEQRIPFTVHVDEDGSNGFVDIELSDFRYYFSIFKLHFKLKFDFDGWIDWLTGDPTVPIFTLDMSWLTDGLYLGTHEGTDGTVNVRVPVWEQIYEDTHDRGTKLKINTRTPQEIFQFVAPDKDFGTRNIIDMRQTGIHFVNFFYYDDELRLMTVITEKHDFCVTTAWDLQTGNHYVLVDNPGIE